MGKKVLVIDDDVKTVELVRLYLSRDGHKVITAYEGSEALRLASEGQPDLIVLDLMLPAINGLDVCRTLKRESDVPIIALTARSTEDDKLIGLGTGADDYISKPFSPKELTARVRATLRRLPEETIERQPAGIQDGDLVLDFTTHEASMAGRPLHLTPVEFKLLGVLAGETGRTFSRAQLIAKVFGYDFDGFDRTIDVHVLHLRRKLDPNSDRSSYIKTVRGAGYKFAGANIRA